MVPRVRVRVCALGEGGGGEVRPGPRGQVLLRGATNRQRRSRWHLTLTGGSLVPVHGKHGEGGRLRGGEGSPTEMTGDQATFFFGETGNGHH